MARTGASAFRTIESVIRDPIACGFMREFAKSEYSTENLDFWIAADRYKDSPRSFDFTGLKQLAEPIYDEFLKEESAVAEVSLDFATRSQLDEDMREERFTRKLFDGAQRRAVETLRRDMFPRFKTSAHYRRLMARFKDFTVPSLGPTIALLPSQLEHNDDMAWFLGDQKMLNALVAHLSKRFCLEHLLFVREVLDFQYPPPIEETAASGGAGGALGRMRRQSPRAVRPAANRAMSMRETSGDREIEDRAWQLYAVFIWGPSRLCVSPSPQVRKEIEVNLAAPSQMMFNDALNAALLLLRQDLQSFVKSTEYVAIKSAQSKKPQPSRFRLTKRRGSVHAPPAPPTTEMDLPIGGWMEPGRTERKGSVGSILFRTPDSSRGRGGRSTSERADAPAAAVQAKVSVTDSAPATAAASAESEPSPQPSTKGSPKSSRSRRYHEDHTGHTSEREISARSSTPPVQDQGEEADPPVPTKEESPTIAEAALQEAPEVVKEFPAVEKPPTLSLPPLDATYTPLPANQLSPAERFAQEHSPRGSPAPDQSPAEVLAGRPITLAAPAPAAPEEVPAPVEAAVEAEEEEEEEEEAVSQHTTTTTLDDEARAESTAKTPPYTMGAQGDGALAKAEDRVAEAESVPTETPTATARRSDSSSREVRIVFGGMGQAPAWRSQGGNMRDAAAPPTRSPASAAAARERFDAKVKAQALAISEVASVTAVSSRMTRRHRNLLGRQVAPL